MATYIISINQIAEFSRATKSGQKRIVKQQVTPNKLLIPWYQAAKSTMKRFFSDLNVSTITEGISNLVSKPVKNDRQATDKKVSIEALQRLQSMSLPNLLKTIKYELIKPIERDVVLNGVEIKISPDVLIKGTYKGKVVYGAIKFHVCKGKPFDLQQGQYVASLLRYFLEKKIAKPGEIVIPELCLCLDVFADRLVPSPDNLSEPLGEVKRVCEEVKNVWNSV